MARPTAHQKPKLVLFRYDLRISDNLALATAAETGAPLICLFVWDEEARGVRKLGGARRWWLHLSLDALSKRLKALGAPLLLRRGPTAAMVKEVVDASGADAVHWNRRHEPAEARADERLAAGLKDIGVASHAFEGQLLHDPGSVRTKTGGPYKVYTPFWHAIAQSDARDPADPPHKLHAYEGKLMSDELDDWQLLPTRPDWAGGLREARTPGEEEAQRLLQSFLADHLDGYGDNRDLPSLEHASSRLSPHLAFGEITPARILSSLASRVAKGPPGDREKYRKELAWRDFCYHLLWQKPDLATENFNGEFDRFEWGGTSHLKAWKRGQTGYPIVDAGMRELWQTGTMHNRVRMIAASFLIKHLLIDWRVGERWFWDTLVDADPASNPGNWQWVAGSGADAAPYFRIFNPILQGEKFDARGVYVRRWVPEIAKLPDAVIHAPWRAPAEVLSKAGVKLGATYPVPVVDHEEARNRAMSAYKAMRGT